MLIKSIWALLPIVADKIIFSGFIFDFFVICCAGAHSGHRVKNIQTAGSGTPYHSSLIFILFFQMHWVSPSLSWAALHIMNNFSYVATFLFFQNKLLPSVPGPTLNPFLMAHNPGILSFIGRSSKMRTFHAYFKYCAWVISGEPPILPFS